MTDAKPTPGPYYRDKRTVYVLNNRPENRVYCYVQGGFMDDGSRTPENELEAVAALFHEAGTVHHETGLTPRQLAQQRAELLDVLEELGNTISGGMLGCSRDHPLAVKARAAIARARGDG